ncbi:hypothetical protein Fot_35356 [Forsythia ovata]|uniref:Uncharacterized protein n=1 Tax=Forsythia ovata TaxID=205694 RepID=A0ABD1SMD3_9LAMI
MVLRSHGGREMEVGLLRGGGGVEFGLLYGSGGVEVGLLHGQLAFHTMVHASMEVVRPAQDSVDQFCSSVLFQFSNSTNNVSAKTTEVQGISVTEEFNYVFEDASQDKRGSLIRKPSENK